MPPGASPYGSCQQWRNTSIGRVSDLGRLRQVGELSIECRRRIAATDEILSRASKSGRIMASGEEFGVIAEDRLFASEEVIRRGLGRRVLDIGLGW